MGIYYRIMGLPPSATEEEIKAAYRRLAWLYHPDANPPQFRRWAEARMRLLNEAYEVLSNPQTRAEYDRSLRDDGTVPPTRPIWEETRPREPSGRKRPWRYDPPPRRGTWADVPFGRGRVYRRAGLFRSHAHACVLVHPYAVLGTPIWRK